MPAATIDLSDRAKRVKETRKLIDSLGGPARAARVLIAGGLGNDVKNVMRTMRRWCGDEPSKEGRIDAASDAALDILREGASRAGLWIAATTDDGRRLAILLTEPAVIVLFKGERGKPLILGAPGLSEIARASLIEQARAAIDD